MEKSLEEVLAELLELEEAGAIDADEFVGRYPMFEDEIRAFLSDRKALELTQIRDNAGLLNQPTFDSVASPQVVANNRIQYFGDYEVLDEVARGGMGVVFRARQTSLDRVVAVKMILAGALASDQDVQRFHTEAKAAGSLDHPNIVPIYEIGEHEGQHYFSMAYVDGRPLDEILGSEPMDADQAVELMIPLAKAISYAHDLGVIHRDLKPSNILVDEQDGPKITDFGLAKLIDATGQTQTGQVLGTPGFMAPEQADENAEVGSATDIYGLGAILYVILTGRPPFQSKSAIDTIVQLRHEEPLAPSQLNRSVPRDLEVICLKCLSKSMSRRYDSALSLASDLKRYQRGEPILARPASRIEKILKWVRRKPMIASLSAAVALLLVVGVSGITWQWSEAHSARIRADRHAADEEQARTLAEQKSTALAVSQDELREKLSLTQLQFAESLMDSGAYVRAERLFWEEAIAEKSENAIWHLMRLYSMAPKSSALNLSGYVSPAKNGRVAITNGDSIEVLDVELKSTIVSIPMKDVRFYRPALSNDGQLLACGYWGRKDIEVWDLKKPDATPRTLIGPARKQPPSMIQTAILAQMGKGAVERTREYLTAVANSYQQLHFTGEGKLVSRTALGIDVWSMADGEDAPELSRTLPSQQGLKLTASFQETALVEEGKEVWLAEARSLSLKTPSTAKPRVKALVLTNVYDNSALQRTLAWTADGIRFVELKKTAGRFSFIPGMAAASTQYTVDCEADDIVNSGVTKLNDAGTMMASLRSSKKDGKRQSAVLVVDLKSKKIVGRIDGIEGRVGNVMALGLSPNKEFVGVVGRRRFEVRRIKDASLANDGKLISVIDSPSNLQFLGDSEFVVGDLMPSPEEQGLAFYGIKRQPHLQSKPAPLTKKGRAPIPSPELFPRLGAAGRAGRYGAEGLAVERGDEKNTIQFTVNASPMAALGREPRVAAWDFSSDGKFTYVAISGKTTWLECYGADDRQQRWKLELTPPGQGKEDWVKSYQLTHLQASPFGRWVVIIQRDGVAVVVNVDKRSVVARLKWGIQSFLDRGIQSARVRLSFSPNNEVMMGVGAKIDSSAPMALPPGQVGMQPPGTVRVVKTSLVDLEMVKEVEFEGTASGVAFGGDGRSLFVSLQSGHLKLLNAKDLQLVRTLDTGENVQAIAVMDHGHTIALGTLHGSIQLWDVESQHRLARFETQPFGRSVESPIVDLRFDDRDHLRFAKQTTIHSLDFSTLRKRVESNRSYWKKVIKSDP